MKIDIPGARFRRAGPTGGALSRGLAVMLVLAGLVSSLAGQGARHRIGPDEIQLSAQPYQPVPAFTAAATAVQVEARVLGRPGQSAAALSAGDFSIEDDGHPQVIASFERVIRPGAAAPAGAPQTGCAALPAPHAIVLFFDDLSGSANDLAYAREKALAYLDQAHCGGKLPAGETASLATASGNGSTAFFSDMDSLRAALRKIGQQTHVSLGAGCPRITPSQAWEIVQTDANPGDDATALAMMQAERCGACIMKTCNIFVRNRGAEVWEQVAAESEQILAGLRRSVEYLASRPGRRTLVLTSPGFLTQQQDLQQQQQSIIDVALRNGVVLDALDAKGLTAPEAANAHWDDPWLGDPTLDFWRLSNEAGGFSAVDSAMWELSESTGGDFLHDNNNLASGYQQAIEGPDVYYSMTFIPSDPKSDGRFHHLKVSVNRKGNYPVAARYGYFASSPEDAPLSTAQQQALMHAVLGTDRRKRIDGIVAGESAPGGIHLTLRLNPNTLSLARQNGRHIDRVVMVFALFDSQGHYATGERVEARLRLTGDSLKAISRRGVGLPVGTDLRAKAGTYQLRVVAYEPSTGAFMAITGKLDVQSGDPGAPQ